MNKVPVDISRQRCFNHAEREAVAQCLECLGFFCRECVTEHEDRLVCASCLRKLASTPLFKRAGFAGAIRTAQCVLGLLVAWFFFYLVGELLLRLPSSFHEGTLWK